MSRKRKVRLRARIETRTPTGSIDTSYKTVRVKAARRGGQPKRSRGRNRRRR